MYKRNGLVQCSCALDLLRFRQVLNNCHMDTTEHISNPCPIFKIFMICPLYCTFQQTYWVQSNQFSLILHAPVLHRGLVVNGRNLHEALSQYIIKQKNMTEQFFFSSIIGHQVDNPRQIWHCFLVIVVDFN